MIKKLRAIFIVACFSLLQACAGISLEGQPHYEGPATASHDSATVYFFRNANHIGSAVDQKILISGNVVGILPNGGYFKTQLDAGTYTVESVRANAIQGKSSDDHFDITVKNGQIYFIAQQTSPIRYTDSHSLTEIKSSRFGGTEYHFRWALIPQDQAETLMRRCRLVPDL